MDQNVVRVALDRSQAVLQVVTIFMRKLSVSARHFVTLLGKLNAAGDYVTLGQFHQRPLFDSISLVVLCAGTRFIEIPVIDVR